MIVFFYIDSKKKKSRSRNESQSWKAENTYNFEALTLNLSLKWMQNSCKIFDKIFHKSITFFFA